MRQPAIVARRQEGGATRGREEEMDARRQATRQPAGRTRGQYRAARRDDERAVRRQATQQPAGVSGLTKYCQLVRWEVVYYSLSTLCPGLQ